MEQRILGNTGESVSLIGLGALEIGRDWGIGSHGDTARPTEAQAALVLRRALDLGITLIDTASAYHASESRIGQALAGRRDQYFLASKCGEHNREPGTYYDFSEAAIRDSIERSLERLGTPVIDLMQIHFGPEPRRVLAEGDTVRAMRKARDKGQVRFLGASCDADMVPDIIALKDFDVVQLTYNLLDRRAEDAIRLAADHGLGVTVRFPLAMGWLTPKGQSLRPDSPKMAAALDQSLALVDNNFGQLMALALQFIARMPEVQSILVGTKNPMHLEQAVRAAELPLPDGLIAEAARLTGDTWPSTAP